MPDDWKTQMRGADAQELNQDFQEVFKVADGDGDELLNQAEFICFLDMWSAKITAKFGSSMEFTDEEKETLF